MLKKEIVGKLNEQLNLELFSSNLYLQMSAWCNNKGLDGAGQFFKSQSSEETDQMHRLFNYINSTGAMPIIGAIKSPLCEFSYLTKLVEHAYQHEQQITQNINELAHITMMMRDYSTFNFLEWYIVEQHKEEKMFKLILDKLSLVNIDSNGLLIIDQYLKNIDARNSTNLL